MAPVNKMVLNQGFLVIKLTYSLRKFYCRHRDLVNRYGIYMTFSRNQCHSCSLIYSDCWSHNASLLSSFMTYLKISTRIRGRRPLVEQELLAPEFTPDFSGVRFAQSLVFCVVICRSLFDHFLLAIVLCSNLQIIV